MDMIHLYINLNLLELRIIDRKVSLSNKKPINNSNNNNNKTTKTTDTPPKKKKKKKSKM